MTKSIRSQMALALIVALGSAAGFAQAGADVYKSKCQMCHGANGAADTPTAKMMKVKPLADPDIKKLSEDDMIASVKNGKGKMQPFKDKITDQQIKDSVDYYRNLK